MTQFNDPSEPLVGRIFSILIAIATCTTITSLATRKIQRVQGWSGLPGVAWIVFAIYLDSWMFILVSSTLKFGVGLNTSFRVCEGALFLCLTSYVLTKLLIYMFLVEKAYVIRQGTTPKSRLKSKLYLFNSFGMLGCFAVVGVFNLIYRITSLEDGRCVIGMERTVMIPLISFELLVNVYLTILFLIPLRTLYNFQGVQRSSANERMRTIAYRTFIGAVSTTASSVVNLTVLMALNGEPAWVCFVCCQLDIAYSAIIVHWVTSKDKTTPAPTYIVSGNSKGGSGQYQNKSANGVVAGEALSTKAGHGGGKRNSSGNTKVLFVRSGCAHQCNPAAGCYNGGGGGGANNNNAIDRNGARGHTKATAGSDSTTIITENPVESTRSESLSKLCDFSKYGSCFADEMEHIEMDQWDLESGSIEDSHRSDEEDEIKLVPVNQRSRAMTIAQKTTVVVKSTNISDLEKGSPQDNRRVILGSMTVCSAGESDGDEADDDKVEARRCSGSGERS